MKLKKYDTSTDSGSFQGPYLRITRGGIWTFNKGTAKILGVEASDRITLFQDEGNLKDWYMHIDRSPSGFLVRDSAGQLRFSSKPSYVAILGSLGKDPDQISSVAIQIGKKFDHNGLLLLPLLTSGIKIKLKRKS